MIDKAQIKKIDNHLYVRGDLNFQTVMPLWQQSLLLLDPLSLIKMDLKDVTSVNSAGLALLLEWIRYAKKTNKTLEFYQIPKELISIAKVSNVDDLIFQYVYKK